MCDSYSCLVKVPQVEASLRSLDGTSLAWTREPSLAAGRRIFSSSPRHWYRWLVYCEVAGGAVAGVMAASWSPVAVASLLAVCALPAVLARSLDVWSWPWQTAWLRSARRSRRQLDRIVGAPIGRSSAAEWLASNPAAPPLDRYKVLEWLGRPEEAERLIAAFPTAFPPDLVTRDSAVARARWRSGGGLDFSSARGGLLELQPAERTERETEFALWAGISATAAGVDIRTLQPPAPATTDLSLRDRLRIWHARLRPLDVLAAAFLLIWIGPSVVWMSFGAAVAVFLYLASPIQPIVTVVVLCGLTGAILIPKRSGPRAPSPSRSLDLSASRAEVSSGSGGVEAQASADRRRADYAVSHPRLLRFAGFILAPALVLLFVSQLWPPPGGISHDRAVALAQQEVHTRNYPSSLVGVNVEFFGAEKLGPAGDGIGPGTVVWKVTYNTMTWTCTPGSSATPVCSSPGPAREVLILDYYTGQVLLSIIETGSVEGQ